MRTKTSIFSWVCAAVLAISVAPAAELPDGFRLEPVLGGLTDPSDIADTLDGRILITERTTGNLRVVRRGELALSPICSVSADATGEGGLIGLAVHPEFTDNGWVYLYYTDLAAGVNKVTRFTLGLDSCWGATEILSDLETGSSGLRNGGGMSFGPDGKLYVATGDAEDSGNGQAGQTLLGKILRLNDDGSIPEDNPDEFSAVFATGVRDGRGLTVNSAGQVYVADSGATPSSDHDEIHLVASDGNLGWADETGFGGVHDQPLAAWLPAIGIGGVADYNGLLFPNLDADGLDNDEDSYGPDERAGEAFVDDNGQGVCIGSEKNGLPCTNDLNCTPLRNLELTDECEKVDDPAEYCLGGVALGDDDCDNVGPEGIDEPDESFLLDVFSSGANEIRRAVLTGAQDQLSYAQTFMDSTALAGCPTGWTGLMTGRDGHLYALATNGGGSGGALYRIVHDGGWGPREVSGPGSYVPLSVAPHDSLNVKVSWEDIRDDAMQPQDDGSFATGLGREYTIWRGEIGTWYSHVAIDDGIAGDKVNDTVRSTSVSVMSDVSHYFLVSARSDNYNGTLGHGTSGERQGFDELDICETVGEYAPPQWDYFKCGRDFTLVDSHGRTRHMHEFRGKAMLLDFSAEWCGPCNTEANLLEGMWQEYKDRGVEFITIIYDEEVNGTDWDGRPTPAECRLWEKRGSVETNHTFNCWADPTYCDEDPCAAGAEETKAAHPLYDRHAGAAPTNVIVDQGLGVTLSIGTWDEEDLRGQLDLLVGAADTCLH